MNEAKANLCACGKHIMRFQREPGVWVMEADEHGDKHGFEECPPDAKGFPRHSFIVAIAFSINTGSRRKRGIK